MSSFEVRHRDPGSGQAQLNEADLQQQLATRQGENLQCLRIVNMMEYYEFDTRVAFRVCYLLRDAPIMIVLFFL